MDSVETVRQFISLEGIEEPSSDAQEQSEFTSLYLSSGSGWAFVRHQVTVDVRSSTAVLLCPPLGLEGLVAERAFRALASGLSASGLRVMRLDYRCTGDSSGWKCDCGAPDSCVEDIVAAAGYLNSLEGVERLAIVGLRTGATLAAIAAATMNGISDLVLWSPCIKGRSYLRELRFLGMTGMAREFPSDHGSGNEQPSGVHAGGFSLSMHAASALDRVDLMNLERRPAEQILLVGETRRKPLAGLTRRMRELGADVFEEASAEPELLYRSPYEAQLPTVAMENIIAWLTDRRLGMQRKSAVNESSPSSVPTCSAVLRMDHLVEAPVFFEAGERTGRRLFGILARPHETRNDDRPAVILLNAGCIHHVGPGRLYVEMARRWGQLGLVSLRMDLAGIGESAASEEAQANRFFPPTAVADVRAALDFLESELGTTRFILFGLCSGASIALKAAQRDERVTGVVMVNAWSFEVPQNEVAEQENWSRAKESAHYRRVIFSRDSWLKVVRGEADVARATRLVFTSLVDSLAQAARRAVARLLKANSGRRLQEFSWLENRLGTALLVYGDQEPGLHYLRMRLGSPRPAKNESVGHTRFRVEVIRNADHNFTTIDSQQRLANLVTRHLESLVK